MSETKTLYKGTFNWQGQVMEDWVRAQSEDHAYVLLTARLAVEIGTTSYSVRNYFKARPRQYTIKEVKEDARRK